MTNCNNKINNYNSNNKTISNIMSWFPLPGVLETGVFA